MENFVALRHGSIERRSGTLAVSTHSSAVTGRVFEFPVTDTVAYGVALLDDGFLYPTDRGGNLHGDELIPNGDFRDGLEGFAESVTGKGSIKWINGRVLVQTGGAGGNVAVLTSSMTANNNVADHLLTIEAEYLTGSKVLTVFLGTTPGGNDVLSESLETAEKEISFLVELSADVGTRYTSDNDRRVDSAGNVLITSGQVLYLSIGVNGSSSDDEARWWIDRVSFRERNAAQSSEVALAHPYDDNDLNDLQMEMVPGEHKAFFVTGRKPPYELAYNETEDSWSFEAVSFKGRPATWTGEKDWDTSDSTRGPSIGDVVELLAGYTGGGVAGNVYRFKGSEVDLSAEDFSGAGWNDLGDADLYEDFYDYTTDDGSRYLEPGDVVFLVAGYAGGGTAENVYKWGGSIDLSAEDYSGTNWQDLGAAADYQAVYNYPGTVTFFGGRSWWGAYPETPDTVNASKSAEYKDLRLSDATDADGIEVTIDDHSHVQWMRGEQDLLVGTKNGEFIFKAEAGPITPSDISANKQSANGSAKMQAEPIGNSVAYTSLDGTKIRDMEYKFVVNGWQSMDISFTGEHLFKEYGRAKEIMFAKDPESTIYFVTDKGFLLGCTFDPANDVIGWFRLSTQGKVVSACVVRDKGVAELWLLVDRYIGANKTLILERMTSESYLDSGAAIHLDTPSTAISGFTHLAGQAVQVVVDGVRADDVVLDSSGNGTASISGKKIQIGFGYTATMETLPTDVPVPGGTGYIHKSRWNRMYARLYDSFIPLINGQLPATQVTPGNEYNGIIDVVNLGWDLDSINTISMEDPYPCRISGIFGELEENIP